jgi:hypothetical protein
VTTSKDQKAQEFTIGFWQDLIWNHGQGWRFQLAQDFDIKAAATSRNPVPATTSRLKSALNSVPPLNGYRSVSLDEDTGNILFNSDIQKVLDQRFSARKLDVLGFDACLMAMAQASYAFRNSVNVMIGSEELEPGEGWQYSAWLEPLTQNSALNGADVAKAVVESYKRRYGDVNLTTLSALDLARAEQIATSISLLGSEMSSQLTSERGAIAKARGAITPYGQAARLSTSIDLEFFLERYRASTNSTTIKDLIDKVRKGVRDISNIEREDASITCVALCHRNRDGTTRTWHSG